MMGQFERAFPLLGETGFERLQKAKVMILGLGGVGSYVCEALVRAGVGTLILVDHDVIEMSNLNRQLFATHETIGRLKVNVAKERALTINPQAQIQTIGTAFLPDNQADFHLSEKDYVIDAIDMVTAKIALAETCFQKNIPLISAMGTGNKWDATAFEITDITKTSVCPLARVMRRELKARNVAHLKVIYSKEQPSIKKTPPASLSYVPAVAGLMLAGEVIQDLVKG